MKEDEIAENREATRIQTFEKPPNKITANIVIPLGDANNPAYTRTNKRVSMPTEKLREVFFSKLEREGEVFLDQFC